MRKKKWKKKVEKNMIPWSMFLNCGFLADLDVFIAVTTFLLRYSSQRCLTSYQDLMGSAAEICIGLSSHSLK